ncbi:hypothetical protein [Krasilnikovia sp. MM14-A1004]|uniref:hypothetical protein n=1 Tax=Krasilnikovia sp. MM14-A1004 TaxID=3373541 RepID=UPI00399CDA65
MDTRRWGQVGLATLVSIAVAAPAAPAFADPAPSTITANGPGSVARNGSVTLTGTFTGGVGLQLHVSKHDLAGNHALPDVTTLGAGVFTVMDIATVGGTNTYTISFDGDANFAATSTTATVTVSRAATALSLSTNAANYKYGATATITAKLGKTHDSRRVCLYATPADASRTLIRCVTANSSGVATATWRMTRRTSFRAVFAGDQWYAPAGVSRTATAGVRLEEVMAYYYKTSHGYKVFRSKVDPLFGARVTPDKTGGCLTFTLQRYRNGKWRTAGTLTCARVQDESVAAAWIRGTHPVGSKWRTRAKFAGDSLNTSTTGPWLKYRYTR